MHREYVKWYSPSLGREMEMLVFGHAGLPMLVFPTSMGRFFEYEDRGMIGALHDRLEGGRLQVFCVDSVDLESWYNKRAHPGYRAYRHSQYDDYLSREVIAFIHSRNASPELVAHGCSFGGYHAVNFAFRHPDQATGAVSMGGAFDIHQFVHGYWDEHCYFNCPTAYVPNLSDDWYLSRIRRMKIVLAAGEWDICLGENTSFSGILHSKSIPHWLDIWGDQTKHDWPWWHRMAAKYF
jgi:esterase/lipase superfamily enzyme